MSKMLSPRKIEEISKSAYQDVFLWIDKQLEDPTYRDWFSGTWKDVLSEVRGFDKKFSGARAKTFLGFIGPFLDWLEKRKKDTSPGNPWEWDYNNSFLRIKRDTSCYGFLDLFLGVLRDVIEPGNPEKGINGRAISQTLREFGYFVAKNNLEKKPWILAFEEKPQSKDFSGFASWLMVCVKEKQLHINYDKNLINKKSLNTRNFVESLEKLFLHELGHASSDLDYYLDETKKIGNPQQAFIASACVHESHAWLYAYFVHGLISSIRSHVSRLIENSDNEWM